MRLIYRDSKGQANYLNNLGYILAEFDLLSLHLLLCWLLLYIIYFHKIEYIFYFYPSWEWI